MRTVPIPLPINKYTCGDCPFNEDAQDVAASRECRAFNVKLTTAPTMRAVPRCELCTNAELVMRRQAEVVAAAVAYKECKEDGIVIGRALNRLFKAIDDLKGT